MQKLPNKRKHKIFKDKSCTIFRFDIGFFHRKRNQQFLDKNPMFRLNETIIIIIRSVLIGNSVSLHSATKKWHIFLLSYSKLDSSTNYINVQNLQQYKQIFLTRNKRSCSAWASNWALHMTTLFSTTLNGWMCVQHNRVSNCICMK